MSEEDQKDGEVTERNDAICILFLNVIGVVIIISLWELIRDFVLGLFA